jgi:GT2 family glycosyltransferase
VSRPSVGVVMPFAGTAAQALEAVAALRALSLAPGDTLILADNAGTAPDEPAAAAAVTVVRAGGERSPAHARNAGAAALAADVEWILFLDADCSAPADLLDLFFAEPVEDAVGALAGAVAAAPPAGRAMLAERYGAAKSFLDTDAHLAHPYLPRAAAANLCVRRAAFEQVGGFLEGVRAAEDTDFCWRLQLAGWRLEARPGARVTHRYRTSVGALRRQWRGYAAGRAWLARRYDGFEPEPALVRAMRRARAAPDPAAAPAPAAAQPRTRAERAAFLALDAVLGVDELVGFALSNRPSPAPERPAPAGVVLVADRFPASGDAAAIDGARVEAAARGERGAVAVYWEDDGLLDRARALARLLAAHPLRCARDRLDRRPGDPGLSQLAPAVARLAHEPGVPLRAIDDGYAADLADRLARLSGHPLDT